jgi:integrase
LEAKKMKNILLREVDLQFIHSFDAYLKTLVSAQYKKPLQESYIFKTHEQFRAVLNRAVEYEYINRNPYNKGFKIKRNVARERAILTWTEIDKMQEHTLGDNAHLQKVRDLFLFCCFVGLRFSDLKKLKKSEFLTFGKRVWLQIVQKKTKTPLFVPLFEPAKQIYQKYLKLYKSNSEDLFFNSVPNNGELNASIKSIAKIVGIEKHLTWHSSRHTFATTVNMEFNKGNFEDTSKLLGQSGLDTVQIYAKLTRERLDDVADEFDKRYKERQKKKKGGKRDKGENSNDDNNPKD